MIELLNTITTLLDLIEKLMVLSNEDFKTGIVLFSCLNVTPKNKKN